MNKHKLKKEILDQEIALKEAIMNKANPKKMEKKWEIKPLSWNTFRSRQAKPVTFMIENFLEKYRSNMIFGDSGSGKSRLAWEMVNSIAFGKNFFDCPTLKGKVLIIDGEMNDGEIQQRQDQWTERCLANGVDLDEADFENISFFTKDMIYEMGSHPFDLYDEGCRAAIEPVLKQFDLVVFDNFMSLASLNSLSQNYTDAEAWEHIRSWVERLEKEGLTFLWVHHSNKEGSIRGTNTMKQHMTVVLKTLRPKIMAPDNIAFHAGIVFEKGRSIKEIFKTPMYIRLIDDYRKDPRRPENIPRFNGWFRDPISENKFNSDF